MTRLGSPGLCSTRVPCLLLTSTTLAPLIDARSTFLKRATGAHVDLADFRVSYIRIAICLSLLISWPWQLGGQRIITGKSYERGGVREFLYFDDTSLLGEPLDRLSYGSSRCLG